MTLDNSFGVVDNKCRIPDYYYDDKGKLLRELKLEGIFENVNLSIIGVTN